MFCTVKCVSFPTSMKNGTRGGVLSLRKLTENRSGVPGQNPRRPDDSSVMRARERDHLLSETEPPPRFSCLDRFAAMWEHGDSQCGFVIRKLVAKEIFNYG